MSHTQIREVSTGLKCLLLADILVDIFIVENVSAPTHGSSEQWLGIVIIERDVVSITRYSAFNTI